MRLYNSLSRQVEDVVPVNRDGVIRMYSCGPTVYRYAHIGNMRSFMLGDLIRRALRLEGHQVRWIMNITDVGHMTDEVSDAGRDRMELAEEDEGLTAPEISEKYTQAFLDDMALVGIEPADHYPRATDHIPEMIDLTQRLLKTGLAYEADGTVYFDVTAFPGYGRLSGNTLDKLRAGHRHELVADPNKRHPEDFSLWKKAGSGRALKWPSPWGDGYPGWHIECSAMSLKHLGERFDIHTGGNDMIFPHHEDERAQSDGATGHPVVSIWAYGGFLQMAGQKMAKSKRNIYRVTDLVDEGIDPLAYRLLCLGTRYRREMEFDWDALEGSNARLAQLRQRMAEWSVEPAPAALGDRVRAYDRRFREAVADDLDLPRAVVALNELVSSDVAPGEKYALMNAWDSVLGLDLDRAAREHWVPSGEVLDLVRQRDEARAAQDFAAGDAIRDRLAAMGLEVMDTPEGTRVRPKAGR